MLALRYIGFFVLALALDLALGIVGYALGGDRGAAIGSHFSNNLCFGLVLIVLARHGWRSLANFVLR